MRASEKLIGYLLLLPGVIALVAIIIYPTIFAISVSLHRWYLYRPDLGMQFVGLQNYIDILLSTEFHQALTITLIFVALSTGLSILLGLGEALLISKVGKGSQLISSFMILPIVIAPVVVGFGWRFMYHESTGIITAYFLPLLGIHVKTILGSPQWALYGCIAADVWNQTPLVFLILLAGILSMPQAPFEAAEMDGASSLQIFRYITLPLLKPAIIIAAILRIIDSFKMFDLLWIMTSGGPGSATTNLIIEGYKTAFVGYRMGKASAYGIIIMYIILGISIVFIRILVGKEEKG